MSQVDAQTVVIGAGPAGARCAEMLASEGSGALILESTGLKQPKLCGGLLNRRSQRVMHETGLELPGHVLVGSNTPALAHPALEYHDIDNSIRARYNPSFRNIDRKAFDDWLISRAVDRGAQIRLNCKVTALTVHTEHVELTTPDGPVTARRVIDASGWAAVSRKPLNGPEPTRLMSFQGEVELDPDPQAMWAVYRSCYTPFFGWIIPKGEGRYLVGAGLPDDATQPSRLDVLPDYILNRSGGMAASTPRPWQPLAPVLEYIDWRGYKVRLLSEKPRGAPLTCPQSASEFWWGRGPVFAIGEASGLVSPFSGEGISYALSSAYYAAGCSSAGFPAKIMGTCQPEVLRRLWAARIKARVGASAWLRPWALWVLPWHTGEPLKYHSWQPG